ncbi:MAG TPA: ABC transporter permease [Candidatus Cybelea sp.]|nr:ABC transporter permease [Candidatus Cybelea sp.]
MLPLTSRRYGAINWIGLGTLYGKEVRRFWAVATQTVLAPLVTGLLFLAIFVLALGHRVDQSGGATAGTSFVDFLVPGLIMMTIAQNAFANTSSSLMIAKVQGNIVDLLMPPLNAIELTIGVAGGGVTRGVVVGLTTGIAMLVFVPISIAHPGFVIFHAVAASLLMALLGMLTGIWAEKFDHLAAITNFIVTPLSFLSGTFYSTTRLPEVWQTVAHLNPFFYMIDGFRYGFIGHADAPPLTGIVVMLAVDAALLVLVYNWFRRGYRLKA